MFNNLYFGEHSVLVLLLSAPLCLAVILSFFSRFPAPSYFHSRSFFSFRSRTAGGRIAHLLAVSF